MVSDPNFPDDLPLVHLESDSYPSTPIGELFAQKYMPDLGQDIDDFKMFQWKLKNYREQDKRICSPEFECGGHKW